MEVTDRELLSQLVSALSDEISTLSSKFMEDYGEMHDKMTLLEMAFLRNPDNPLLRQVKEAWDERTQSSLERRSIAENQLAEASRRVEQVSMLLQGKTLNEIDAHYKERDKEFEKLRRRITEAFDKIGN